MQAPQTSAAPSQRRGSIKSALDRLGVVSFKKSLRYVCISAAMFFAFDWPGFADLVDLTSGTSGSMTPYPQSFNETRGVDVTVLSGPDLCISSMTLSGLYIRSATFAFVGARIYDSTSGSVIASNTVTVFASGAVTIPISATLVSGSNYRVGFYVLTSPANQGAGTMFDPDPPGFGGFPYTDATGFLEINNAYSIASDSFPSNWNIYVPQVVLEATLCAHLSISLVYPNVLVMWPTSGGNATLEATSDLTDPNGWVTVTNPRTVVGSNVVVTIPLSGDRRFYRLK
jgi:hypothetical protein